MMEACAEIEVSDETHDDEEEVTINMPVEALPLRNIGLVENLYPYPAHYDPPIGRAIRRYFAECRQRARELRDYERLHYSDALYQRCRRLGLRLYAHMKKNATYRPWEEYEKKHFG